MPTRGRGQSRSHMSARIPGSALSSTGPAGYQYKAKGGGTMKILVSRPRSLLVVVALAVTAAMCPLSTANAASFASAAPHEQAASSAQCNFAKSLQTCESTDPTVAYYDSPSGDTSSCTFAFDVTWGDGGSVTNTITDPTAGRHLVGEHTYARPGVYTIAVTVTVTAGPCTGTDSVHTFTLLAPPLPTRPSPVFVCVTGPGGSCLHPGAGVPQSDTWDHVPSAWLTSPVVSGCAISVVELLTTIAAPELDLEWLVLVEALGGAAYFEQSTGNLLFKLAAAMPFKDCYELATYLLNHQSPPPDLQSLDSVNLAQRENPLGTMAVLRGGVSPQSLFQPVSKSQLKKLGKLPFLRQRFGYAVAQVGSEAALNRKYGTAWSAGTHKSVVCHLLRGAYRCDWRFQDKGTRHTGYVLIGVTGNRYWLERVA